MKDSQGIPASTRKLCTSGMQVLPLMHTRNGLEKSQGPLVMNNGKKVQTLLEFHKKDNGRRDPLNAAPPSSISRRLDDMLSMPFSSRIINYEPPRGFIVPKFSTYDGSSDPFDHIMHYRQLMTLDIGNDMLLCKVFPANLQGQAFSWFHRLPMNLVDNFRDLSKAILQVESYSMDVVLQIFKLSICPGTPFFESLAKKPPTTMDDLFRRANKYSMLEDDVRATTQQVLVAGQAARNDTIRNFKSSSQQGPSNRGQMAWTNKIKSHGERSQQKIGESSRDHGPRAPTALVRAVIDYIHGGPLDEEYNSRRKRQRLLRAAIVREHKSSIRPGLASGSVHPRILVDPGSSADLLQVSVIKQMGFIPSILENPGRILFGFNGASTTSLDLSPFNAILGRTWLHSMKVIPSTYHQVVSSITQNGQVDFYGSQLAARQCYQITRETGPNTNHEQSPKEASPPDQ
ncbi:hypothetical protein CK203_110085 [Vitis vinifera]|uniref:Retrotransposon gag domain-containing protein n=1 Tax=Vitis vinifera TaxID=29760 RepID=A0A438CDM6_VITVI|nr:hypothetical protein CK203_110085 [Vitis vinifera]